MVTPALTRLLQTLADAEDREDWDAAEIVADGIQVWVGEERFHWKTVNQALRLTAIRDTSDEGSRVRRYTINEVGRLLLRAPDQEDAILRCFFSGITAWTISGDKFVPLDT